MENSLQKIVPPLSNAYVRRRIKNKPAIKLSSNQPKAPPPPLDEPPEFPPELLSIDDAAAAWLDTLDAELDIALSDEVEEEDEVDELDNELDELIDDELTEATELAADDAALLLDTESAGTVPVKPVAFSLVNASTKMPSLITTFSGAKSTRFSSKLQLALPQRAVSKLLNSSRHPPSKVLVVVL